MLPSCAILPAILTVPALRMSMTCIVCPSAPCTSAIRVVASCTAYPLQHVSLLTSCHAPPHHMHMRHIPGLTTQNSPCSNSFHILSACTVCLSRNPYEVAKCQSHTLWSGGAARVCRNDPGRLINLDGLILCTDWQTPPGCNRTSHDARHECSGCGKPDYGAQGYSLAQSPPGEKHCINRMPGII